MKKGLHDWQNEISRWGDETFGVTKEVEALLRHLLEEAIELHEDQTEEEAADVFILLVQFAHRRGFSLEEAVRLKMEKNRSRKWSLPGDDGIIRHIKEET